MKHVPPRRRMKMQVLQRTERQTEGRDLGAQVLYRYTATLLVPSHKVEPVHKVSKGMFRKGSVAHIY